MSNICSEYRIPRKLIIGFGVIGAGLALFLWLTAGSAQAGLPTRDPNKKPSTTAPTLTATATLTETAIPTETATATPTGTVIATATPNPTGTQTPSGKFFIPIITAASVNWKQVDKDKQLLDLLTIEACGNKPILAGTGSGLSEWIGTEWKQITQVPGPVYDILFSNDCSNVYLAILGHGVWIIEGQNAPKRLGNIDSVPTSRTLALQNEQLFVGTHNGVYQYDDGKDWVSVGDPGEVTHLNQQVGSNRLYATIWQKEIRYNDNCGVLTCLWPSIQPPPGDNRLLKVIGYQYGANERLILGTSRGLYWRDNAPWKQAQTPTGTVFALAQTSDGKFAFAGMQVKGPWQTTDNGVNWTQIGSSLNSVTVVDFAIDGNTLYAATYDDGLWQIRFR